MRASKGSGTRRKTGRERAKEDERGRSPLSRNRLPNLAWKLPHCVGQERGNGWPDPSSLPAAASSYFIPRLHNRLFVSRFYPRSESQPSPSPSRFRAPRGYLSADGIERVGGSEGMVKKCPEDIVNLLGSPSPPHNPPFSLYIYSATEPRSICFWAPLRGIPEDGPA